MKTAISVPDTTFARVTARAAELGISRSQLFTEAAEAWLAQLDAQGITSALDAALVGQNTEESSQWALDQGNSVLGSAQW